MIYHSDEDYVGIKTDENGNVILIED